VGLLVLLAATAATFNSNERAGRHPRNLAAIEIGIGSETIVLDAELVESGLPAAEVLPEGILAGEEGLIAPTIVDSPVFYEFMTSDAVTARAGRYRARGCLVKKGLTNGTEAVLLRVRLVFKVLVAQYYLHKI
jgi:hypothetical protein